MYELASALELVSKASCTDTRSAVEAADLVLTPVGKSGIYQISVAVQTLRFCPPSNPRLLKNDRGLYRTKF
jgi:hypothetical protein